MPSIAGKVFCEPIILHLTRWASSPLLVPKLVKKARKTVEVSWKLIQGFIDHQSLNKDLKCKHIITPVRHFKISTPLETAHCSYHISCTQLAAPSSMQSREVHGIEPPPLLIWVEVGYLPTGVFSKLITELVQQNWHLASNMCFGSLVVLTIPNGVEVTSENIS